MHFLNEKSGEFLFYKLALTGSAAGALERIEMQAPLPYISPISPLYLPYISPTPPLYLPYIPYIEMQAPLRQLSRHLLPLRNPLEAEVAFSASVDRADVSVPASLVVPAGGRAELPIEWRPLLPQA